MRTYIIRRGITKVTRWPFTSIELIGGGQHIVYEDSELTAENFAKSFQDLRSDFERYEGHADEVRA